MRRSFFVIFIDNLFLAFASLSFIFNRYRGQFQLDKRNEEQKLRTYLVGHYMTGIHNSFLLPANLTICQQGQIDIVQPHCSLSNPLHSKVARVHLPVASNKC